MAQQNPGPQGPAKTTLGSFGPEDIAAFTAEVERLRNSVNIVGSVSVTSLPPLHKVATELVYLDPNPKGLDCYEIYGAGLCLSATAIQRIANAAGVEYLRSERIDDRSDPDVIQWRAVAQWTGLDGVTREEPDNYGLDFGARWEDARARAWKGNKAVKTEAEAKQRADAEVRQMRIHGMQRAETGAKSRAAAKLLGLKRGGWTPEQLARPFLVTKIVPDIDYANDPMARAMLIAKHTGLAKLAFGAGQRLGVFDALSPPSVDETRQLPPADPTTAEPARTSSPETSPASGPAHPTPPADPPRTGTVRDELRRPASPTAPAPAEERDPWDDAPPKPAPRWRTMEEFTALPSVGEQADALAEILRAIGETDAADRVGKAAVDPEMFGAWYAKALDRAGKTSR